LPRGVLSALACERDSIAVSRYCGTAYAAINSANTMSAMLRIMGSLARSLTRTSLKNSDFFGKSLQLGPEIVHRG
jgi:hypothetical protein